MPVDKFGRRDTAVQENVSSDVSLGALKMQDQKMQDLKLEDQVARVENAGPENAGPNYRGGKCRT